MKLDKLNIGIIVVVAIVALAVFYFFGGSNVIGETQVFTNGNIKTEFTQNYLQGFEVKGDYDIKRTDISTGEVLTDKKSTVKTASVVPPMGFRLNPPNVPHIWAKKVLFTPSYWLEDFQFYTFYDVPSHGYIYCWEIMTEEGETKMYTLYGSEQIGYGITSPVAAVSLSGENCMYGSLGNGQCVDDIDVCGWSWFQVLFDSYFDDWFNGNTDGYCLGQGTHEGDSGDYFLNDISNSGASHMAWIIHGDYNKLWCTYEDPPGTNGIVYYNEIDEAMDERSTPYMFTYLGTCGGFDSYQEETIYNAMMKHQDTGTAAIGYTNMGTSEYWSDAYYWTDVFLTKYGDGYSVEQAYWYACSQYPEVGYNNIRFAGDGTVKLADAPEFNEGGDDVLEGDANLDGNVNQVDVYLLGTYVMFGEPPLAEGSDCDMNDDGLINQIDVYLLGTWVMYN